MLTDIETQAGENSGRVLDLIESGRREELVELIRGFTPEELAWVVLALGSALLRQEASNDALIVQAAVLKRQNETFDTANAQLFREKRILTEKVAELREILHARAAASTAKREKRKDAA